MREALVERAIVAGRCERGEDGGIDQSPTLLICPERCLEHGEHLRADRNVATVARVQAGELTVRDESCEACLFLTHPLLTTLERRLPHTEGEQLAGRAERTEASGREFTRHSSCSGPWHRSEAA